MKKRKSRRKFLGPADCVGAIGWWVGVREHWDYINHPNKMMLEGEIRITDDAQTHWVSRKADVKPLYRMRDELDAFITELEQAFKDVEDHNAKSETTD